MQTLGQFAENVFEAFQPFFNPSSPGLRRVVEILPEFARLHDPDLFWGPTEKQAAQTARAHTERIQIGEAALFRAIIADGIRNRSQLATSSWLVEWIEAEEIDPQRFIASASTDRDDPFSVGYALERGVKIELLGMLGDRILPAALELARATVGRDRADLRHVLFALLDEPGGNYGDLSELFEYRRLARLRTRLVDRIVATPESGEDIQAWKALTRPQETVTTHSDAPAIVDTLGRRTFAEVLGARIRDVGAGLRKVGANSDSAFILHMDGPWGSGKSSILNFLKADLEQAKPRWLVIEFNAWRNQRRRPAWLPLILEVRSTAVRHFSWSLPAVWLVWLWWRIRMDWLSYLFALLLISIAGLLVWSTEPAAGGEAAERGLFGLTKAAEDALKALGAIIAAAASFIAMARGFSLGSQRNAEIYLESKSEPFRRIVRLFEWLVWAIHRPVAVFVDDLDRCDCDYVIELLEGIQTSLRAAPIVYVVAGDRNWICSSFEKHYADFSEKIGAPGRPLGYLFLDKVFQLSTSMPRLSARRQAEYWQQLLDRNDPEAAALRPEKKLEAERRAEADIKGMTRKEDVQQQIDKVEPGTFEREARLAAAARQTTTEEAIRAVEHRLQPFAGLLEANPRAMKRLVNAYGLNQARAYLEDRDVSVEALARWTIVELRWPLLADYLVRNWPEIAEGALTPSGFPTPIRELLASAEVREVFGGENDPGRLTIDSLKPILD